jgi:hypothetical protein
LYGPLMVQGEAESSRFAPLLRGSRIPPICFIVDSGFWRSEWSFI